MPLKRQFGEDGSVMVVGVQGPDIYKRENYNQWVQLTDEIQQLKGIKGVLSIGRAVPNYKRTQLTKNLWFAQIPSGR
jgi:hypothetical protein